MLLREQQEDHLEYNTKDRREQLRAAYKELGLSLQPDAFVTLTTNDYGHIHEVTRLLGRFCGMIDRQLLGHKWLDFPAKRLDGLFFIEHTKTNIHAHGLLRFPDVPDADLPFITARKWSRLTETGDTNFQSIYDAPGAAKYCTKEMANFQFDGDQVVLVSQFRKN